MVAEDPDQDPLTYGISGPNAYFFKVTSATGEVKLASLLDYEVKGSGPGRPGRGMGRRGGPGNQCSGGWALGLRPALVRAHWAPSLFSLQTLYLFSVVISVSDGHNSPVSRHGAGAGGLGLLPKVLLPGTCQEAPVNNNNIIKVQCDQNPLVHSLLHGITKI